MKWCVFNANSRPLLICEHGLDAPGWAEYIQRLRETVVVNQPGVDGEDPHHQDDVTSAEERLPYLRSTDTQQSDKTHLQSLHYGWDSFVPHYWIASSSAVFLSAPSTGRRDSLLCRARGRQTSRRTGRGMWWWCRELPVRETPFIMLVYSPKQTL